jgi:menaquinone-dependent protoporphyrinogen oxidase
MTSVLIAYATKFGSTAEVAQAIGEELIGCGLSVEVKPIRDVKDIGPYDAVVVGGPMILGWHADAARFVVKHREALSRKPVAFFLMALSLTQTESSISAPTLYLDPDLVKRPQNPDKLTFRENYATVDNYLKPVMRKAPAVKPVRVGFFSGKLSYARLNLLQKLFVWFVVGAPQGDFRRWDKIRGWAQEAAPLLHPTSTR